MRILHTSDWHVGRTIRGRSRADEHAQALAEITDVAVRESVDLIVVAGDLFDTAAPTPAAEALVYHTLLDLGRAAPVVVVAGNHDNPRRLGAVAPLLELGGIHVATAVRAPDRGGVVDLDVGGTTARIALVPFLSQRAVVRADQLMAQRADQHAARYADRVRSIVAALSSGFGADTVNLVVGHLTVTGASGPDLGGGERAAHTIFDYFVPPQAFPPTTSYVALGHLHRPHRVPGPCPIWYSGSPLHLDFGEKLGDKAVLLVDAEPGRPATVDRHVLASGRKLVTVRGTVDDLAAVRDRHEGALLRVEVTEPPRAGLADEVRMLLPDAVDVAVVGPDRDDPDAAAPRADLDSLRRAPDRLLADYLDERGIDDPRLLALFRELWDRSEDDVAEAAGASDAA